MAKLPTPLLPAGISPGLRCWLLAVVVVITLAAGVDPKGYRFHNEVERLPDGPGLRFGRFGRVHTEPFVTPEQAAVFNDAGFTLEIALAFTNNPSGGYRFLASFHAGEDWDQLVIGQWHQHFIVMNGDDYSHRRRLPRISADASAHSNGPILLTITTGARGTRLYIDGKMAATMDGLRLTIPAAPDRGRLVLGNSVHANNPWHGDVLGFVAFRGTLAADQVASHYVHWRDAGNFNFGKGADPHLLFTFEAHAVDRELNRGSAKADLNIPPRLVALGSRALATNSIHGAADESLMQDMIVNLVGFMPFGFALAFVLVAPGRSIGMLILRVTATGFIFSLSIELAQAWLPSRDSSLLDLTLNTGGALLGAGCVAAIQTRIGARQNPGSGKGERRESGSPTTSGSERR